MTPASFEFLRTFVKERSGIDLAPDKQYLIESRLHPVARAENIKGLDDLVVALKAAGSSALANSVIEAMTTNESSFFRDKAPFDLFRDTMVPELSATRGVAKRLKIWCAAASTGQEPYSLAMTIKEMGGALAGWTTSILGTDISVEVLERAKQGVYSQFEVQRGMPIQLLLKYFKQEGEQWRIDPSLKAMCQFRPFNLLDSFSGLGNFDIVFCRNVLIYFDQQTKQDILDRIAKTLSPDGYLVLGSAETVMGITTRFEQVPGRRGLYRKVAEDKPTAMPARVAGTPLAAAGATQPAASPAQAASASLAAATQNAAQLRQAAAAMAAADNPAKPAAPTTEPRKVASAAGVGAAAAAPRLSATNTGGSRLSGIRPIQPVTPLRRS